MGVMLRPHLPSIFSTLNWDWQRGDDLAVLVLERLAVRAERRIHADRGIERGGDLVQRRHRSGLGDGREIDLHAGAEPDLGQVDLEHLVAVQADHGIVAVLDDALARGLLIGAVLGLDADALHLAGRLVVAEAQQVRRRVAQIGFEVGQSLVEGGLDWLLGRPNWCLALAACSAMMRSLSSAL